MMSETYRIDIEDEQSFELNAETVEQMEVHRSGSQWMIWMDGVRYRTEVLNTGQKSWQIRLNGITFEVEVMDALDQKIDEMGLAEEVDSGLGEVKAPMPGLVLKVSATTGASVEQGDPVIILEAMKMENVIKAPAAGTVSEITVEEGETVDKNAVLFVLE